MWITGPDHRTIPSAAPSDLPPEGSSSSRASSTRPSLASRTHSVSAPSDPHRGGVSAAGFGPSAVPDNRVDTPAARRDGRPSRSADMGGWRVDRTDSEVLISAEARAASGSADMGGGVHGVGGVRVRGCAGQGCRRLPVYVSRDAERLRCCRSASTGLHLRPSGWRQVDDQPSRG